MDTGEYEVVKPWDDGPATQPFRKGRRRERQLEDAIAAEEQQREQAPPQEREPARPAVKQPGDERPRCLAS